MTKEEIFNRIKAERPPVIYLSGKTSTGKSTFAAHLKTDIGYEVIELDEVVRKAVIEPLNLTDRGKVFIEVYRERNQGDWVGRFVTATQLIINEHVEQNKPLIIEGAVANPKTLQEIFASFPNFYFIYFHPTNLEAYKNNLRSRFEQTSRDSSAGLPVKFWDLISKDQFAQFCKDRIITPELDSAIESYAALSAEGSVNRLNEFRQKFQNIKVVEV